MTSVTLACTLWWSHTPQVFSTLCGPSGRLSVPYGDFSILFIASLYIKKADPILDRTWTSKRTPFTPATHFLGLKHACDPYINPPGRLARYLFGFWNNIEIWIFSVSRRELRLGHCRPPFIAAGFLIICCIVSGVLTAKHELEKTATGATWHSWNLPSTYKWRKNNHFEFSFWKTHISRVPLNQNESLIPLVKRAEETTFGRKTKPLVNIFRCH